MTLRIGSILGAFAIVAGFLSAARGGVSYTTRATWQAALSSAPVTETFATAPLITLPINATVAAGAVSVRLNGTANSDSHFGDGGVIDGSREFTGFIQDLSPSNVVQSITFTFPSAVTAWGADFASSATGDLLVATASGSSYQFNSLCSNHSGVCFLGTVESVPFNSVTFTTQSFTSFGEFYEMDNLSYGPVPEPASATLGSLALVGLLNFRRRNG